MKEELRTMNEEQKEASLKMIRKMAKRSLKNAIMIPCVTGIFIFVVLTVMVENGSDDILANLFMSLFVVMIVSLGWIEDIVKNITRLTQVKALKKETVYWTVVSVKKCTNSINIFERWYRYAHYEYGGKVHKAWMVIGRNPINQVTCLVSANDTSKPYAYMTGWFRGILY